MLSKSENNGLICSWKWFGLL